MGPFFWHLLPMPVLLAFTTITLLPRTPLIIIGVAVVAFNRLFFVLVWSFMPLYELRALDFCLSSLPALHNLIVHHHPSFQHGSHTNYVSAFLDSFHSSNLACHFLSTISSESPRLYRTLYHIDFSARAT